jgi:predicted dehydrogenase
LQQTALTTLMGEGISHDVVGHFLVRFSEAYLNELRDFVQRVLAGQQPAVSIEDGRRALAISLAAEDSYREHHAVMVSAAMEAAGPAA